jgi:hypothetical protein
MTYSATSCCLGPAALSGEPELVDGWLLVASSLVIRMPTAAPTRPLLAKAKCSFCALSASAVRSPHRTYPADERALPWPYRLDRFARG